MLKKVYITILLILSACTASFANHEKITDCFSAMSALQSYIEFYYMGTGDYPRSLQDLDSILNDDLTKDSVKIKLPQDPLTGLPFVYRVAEDLKSYRLSAPEPKQYGLEKLELREISWGWMNEVAKEKSLRTRAQLCRGYLELLIASVKKYQEKEKKLPEKIELLVPEYIKNVPLCPQCGKAYKMEHKGNDLVISCPEPKSHKCSIFQASLRSGFKSKLLNEK